MNEIARGAEAVIYDDSLGIAKVRVKKSYRLDSLDVELRKSRTKREAKILEKLFSAGLNVPKVETVSDFELIMQKLDGVQLKEVLDSSNYSIYAKKIAEFLSKMHDLNIIHSDLTTSNMLVVEKKLFFIDFGLSFVSTKVEDKAVDLHLLKRALDSKHFDIANKMFNSILENYSPTNKTEILKRLEVVENRGRNKNK
ncbi:Kae1-associated serine/threonine protein kinase [Candidatus Woesearchaeota archaeon]|nr:Kae1-associated serine/threonine protein kinase [Candidatus Woesearchaeota archaeon]